jgi:hypothetical protein
MSEYFTVEVETTADPDRVEVIVNEILTDADEEVYEGAETGEEGSPIAQVLFHAVDGIRALVIRPDTLVITREPDVPWEMLIDDVRSALRDFFL